MKTSKDYKDKEGGADNLSSKEVPEFAKKRLECWLAAVVILGRVKHIGIRGPWICAVRLIEIL